MRTLKDCWTFEFRGSDCGPGVKAVDVMRLFPCGIFPIMDNFEKWKDAFIKLHLRPGRFSKQGMIPIWAEFDYEGGRPIKIERMVK